MEYVYERMTMENFFLYFNRHGLVQTCNKHRPPPPPLPQLLSTRTKAQGILILEDDAEITTSIYTHWCPSVFKSLSYHEKLCNITVKNAWCHGMNNAPYNLKSI
jgi:hypothetical protein